MAILTTKQLQDMTSEAALRGKSVPQLLAVMAQIDDSDGELYVDTSSDEAMEHYRQHLLAYDRVKALLP